MLYDEELKSEITAALRTKDTHALSRLCERSIWEEAPYIDWIDKQRDEFFEQLCPVLATTGPSSTYDDFETIAKPMLKILWHDAQRVKYIGIVEELLPTLAKRNGELAATALDAMSAACPQDDQNLRLRIAEKAVEFLPKIIADAHPYKISNTLILILEAGGITLDHIRENGADIGIFALSKEYPVVDVVFNTASKAPVFIVASNVYQSSDALLKAMDGAPTEMKHHFESVVVASQKPRPDIDWRQALRDKKILGFPAPICTNGT